MQLRIFLLAALAASTLGSTAIADGPFDKFIPRGRLLKKLRDDIIGPPQPPTPAQRPDGKQAGPTPAVRPGSQANAAGNGPKRPPQQLPQNNRPSIYGKRPAAPNANATQAASGTGQPKSATASTAANSQGFGMQLQVAKNDSIVVTQVAAGGNAAEAGLQRGDVIVEAGGVPLQSMQEFEEISKILGQGDQLEFKISRRGRAGKVTVQHGQPPEPVGLDDEQSVNNRSSAPRRSENATAKPGYRGDFSFVPPADDDSRSDMRSVLDAPVAPTVNRQTSMPAAYGGLQPVPNNSALAPQLQQTVSQQQQQIQLLQRQLQQLQQQQGLTGSGLRRQR